jgi:hypothetical protein
MEERPSVTRVNLADLPVLQTGRIGPKYKRRN